MTTESAHAVKDALLVQGPFKVDNMYFLELPYDGTYEAAKSAPTVIEFRGELYGKTGHNSDRNCIYYRTNTSIAWVYR